MRLILTELNCNGDNGSLKIFSYVFNSIAFSTSTNSINRNTSLIFKSGTRKSSIFP